MTEKKSKVENLKLDTKELELPETEYVRDIDNRVFQGIILQCLAKIPGISPVEGNFLDHVLGRKEGIKGIHTEQDPKTHSISARVEVAVAYGVSIPEKAEEIQTKVVQELVRMTGLHVSQVHVVFKELVQDEHTKEEHGHKKLPQSTKHTSKNHPGDYSDIF